MPEQVFRNPATVSDWRAANRTQRLRETRLGHNWQRFGRTRRVFVRALFVVLAVATLCTQYWLRDVSPQRERLAQTNPYVYQIFDPISLVNRDAAVVDLVGLGNLDAGDTARALPSLAEIGRVWAVRYDNEGIDTKVISNIIADRADREGVENVLLVGHSMGGVIALEVAQHLYQDTSKNVLGVVLDCTPINLHAVRAQERDHGEDMLRWIGWVPGARESRTIRLLVELAAREERFIDRRANLIPRVRIGELKDATADVLRDKIFSTDSASNGLIESQFKTIVASGAIDNLKALTHERNGKPRPAIIFLRPRNSWEDDVVDVDYSQRILIDQSGGVGGSLLVIRMRDTGHADPIQRPEQYNAAILDGILPFLRQSYEDATRARIAGQ